MAQQDLDIRFTPKSAQRISDAVRRVERARVARTLARRRFIGSGASVVRMQVTNPDAAPDVVIAQTWDGVELGTELTPVRVYWARELGEEIYAYVPDGGTDAVYNNEPVDWHEEYSIGRAQYDGQVPTFEGGQWVLAFTRATAVPGL